jgi:uncharacterized protein with GYD domain
MAGLYFSVQGAIMEKETLARGGTMQTFFLVTKLSPDSASEPSSIKLNVRRWMEAVLMNCPEVRWIEHYALLGQYDFISIYEAPDLATAAKVSAISMSLGAQMAESWPAIHYTDYVKLIDGISLER